MTSARIQTQLISLLYEAILLAGLWAVFVLFPHALLGMLYESTTPGWLVWSHTYLLFGAFNVWQWTNGRRTLPMKTWNLHLQTDDGSPLGVQQALMRFFWVWPSYGLFGIGVLWALLDRDGKLLHDRLARTMLVRQA